MPIYKDNVGPTDNANSETPAEIRKAEMARLAEEADAKELESTDPAGNATEERIASKVMPTNSPHLAPNPFDPAALRLDQSFAGTVGVKKLLTTVPVRKPNRQDFVRVHPDPAYRLTPIAIIEVKEDREVYLVTSRMAEALPGEFAHATLFTAINRQGTLQMWPVKLPMRGWSTERMASLRGRGSRTSHDEMDTSYREYVARRL